MREKGKFHVDRVPRSCSEGPFWGNGTIGAVMYVRGKQIRLSMDHVGLWEMRESLPDTPRATFPELLKNREAFRHGEESVCAPTDIFETDFGRTKLPGLGISLTLPEPIIGFRCSTDLQQARSALTLTLESGKVFTGSVCLHSCRNLLELRFQGMEEDCLQLRGEGWDLSNPALKPLKNWQYPPCRQKAEGEIDLICQNYSGDQCGVLAAEKISSDPETQGEAGEIEGTGIEEAAGTGVIIRAALTAGHENREDEMKQQVLRILQESREPGYFRSHEEAWAAYWENSDLEMPNQRLQEACDLERYKIFCNERPQAGPVTLQGVWNVDNRMPPWFGDLHNDLNVQSCYWAAFRTGNAALAAPYIDCYHRAMPRFMQRAEKLFGVKNAVHVPLMMAPNGYAAASEWCFWNMLLGPELFVATDFCWFYEYTQDLTVLREKIYPFLCGVIRLYQGIAVEKADGFLHIPFAQSPEMDGPDGMILADDPGVFLSILHDVLGKMQGYGALLGEDSSALRDFQTRLAPIPLDDTGYQVFSGMPLAHSHRHFSHLFPIFPLGMEGHSPLANRALDHAVDQGFLDFAAFSFPYLAIFAARCGRGNMARTMLEIYCMAFRSPNSFTVNGDPYQNGVIRTAETNAGESSDAFTLESGFFLPAALSEMMVHRVGETLWLFPAVPGDWKNCSFQGLAVEGNHRISGTWADHRLRSGSILPGKTETLIFCLPKSGGEISFTGGDALPCELPHGAEKTRGYRVSLRQGEEIGFVYEG